MVSLFHEPLVAVLSEAASRPLRIAVLILPFMAFGCGESNGLSLVPVEGTVKHGGKRLEWGEVVFTPESGTPGPPAVGAIQADGTFSMRTGSQVGAVVGRHQVTVHHRRKLTEQEIRSLKIPESLIPDKYWKQDESPLKFEVKDGGSNVYDIVIE